jgi:outer membrane murein-binding lipoprotein Lpp
MTQSPDHEARISRLETRMDTVAPDAAAARHLAAAHERELADLGVKVDANRRAINALGEQTCARFDRLEAKVDAGFAELRTDVAELRTDVAELRIGHDDLRAAMRHGFDQSAAGFARIAELITARDDDR